jgi:hypothetical protein
MLAEGNFDGALGIYEQKGAVNWTLTQKEARAELVEKWAADTAADRDRSRLVLAYTNDAVNELNIALRDVRKQRGELEWEDHAIKTAHGRFDFSAGDRIRFTGTDKKLGIENNATGAILAIDGTHLAVRLDGSGGKTIKFDAASFDNFRHSYAGTIYAGQGSTLDQVYLYHSEHWRRAPAYVALTRHKDKTALFVARNTAKDLKELARQVSRSDETRAASMFYQPQPIGPVRPMNAAEILAQFGGEVAVRAQRIERESGADQARRYAPKPPIYRQDNNTAAGLEAPPSRAGIAESGEARNGQDDAQRETPRSRWISDIGQRSSQKQR